MSVALMVPIETAAQQTGASVPHIRRLIDLGLLQAAQNLERNILVPLEELRRLESILEDADLVDLEGRPIHISKASRKYDIPTGSLSRWYRSGYIRKVGQEKNRVLLDEGDVAFIKLVIEAKDLRPGQSLGYVLKHL